MFKGFFLARKRNKEKNHRVKTDIYNFNYGAYYGDVLPKSLWATVVIFFYYGNTSIPVSRLKTALCLVKKP